MDAAFWSAADTVTSVLVNISVLAAALAALVKFRVFAMFSHRYRSELQCRHHVLPTGQIAFEADYSVHNTGERPIDLTSVTLQLCASATDGPLLVPDPGCVLAERVLGARDADKRGLFRIEAGERSIFTLRCVLAQLDTMVFVRCQLAWKDNRALAPYIGLYVRADETAVPTTVA
jgi:hypothetical protein